MVSEKSTSDSRIYFSNINHQNQQTYCLTRLNSKIFTPGSEFDATVANASASSNIICVCWVTNIQSRTKYKNGRARISIQFIYPIYAEYTQLKEDPAFEIITMANLCSMYPRVSIEK